MNIFKRILSILLLSIYVLSSTHGATLHCQDSDHQHDKHNHDNHSHEQHEGSDQISISHSIFHSVVHFIEHLAHDHDSCLEILFVDNDNSNNYNSGLALFRPNRLMFSEFTIKTFSNSIENAYSNIYLVHSLLRGPPAIV